MLCRVPIYGQKDAGRRLWLRIKEEAVSRGWTHSRVYPALFFRTEGGRITAMFGCHVDDILSVAEEGAQHYIDELLSLFEVGTMSSGQFRFCGLEIDQDEEFNIRVTAKDNTEKIRPVSYPRGALSTSEATPGETEQLMSVVGSLAWIARQVRADLCYRVSRLQTNVKRARRYHLKEANDVVEYAIRNSSFGLFFKAGIFEFESALVVSMTDASWANDKAIVRDLPEPHRSQRARLVMLCEPGFATGTKTFFYPISFGSNLIRRVCRSTLQAETQALQAGVEEGCRLRAALAEMQGRLRRDDWESSAAEAIRHLWLTDCKSLHDHLVAPVVGKVSDKRLSIDLCSLRQDLWTVGGEDVDRLSDSEFQDKVRWIDTSSMLVDCLTKAMAADDLRLALESGFYDTTADPTSVAKKLQKSGARQEKRKLQTVNRTDHDDVDV